MRAAAAVLAMVAAGAPLPPAPLRRVEDHAAFLSPATRATLDARLDRYEQATGHQVVVWIGTTLAGAPLDDWAVRTFAAWKLGRARLDDGVALFVLADDRALDIEVGYGLEGQLPDAVAARIVREVMAPRLRAGDRDGAVSAGVDAVLAAIEGRPWTDATAPPPRTTSALTWILAGLAILALLVIAITHPRLALVLLWALLPRGRGDGGGRARGFRGGGGRSGGGGARGGW